jgi:Tfp pilus assembly protein PilF
MRRPLLLLLVLGVLAASFLASRYLVRVPEGSVLVGAGPPIHVLSPGIHVLGPGEQRRLYPDPLPPLAFDSRHHPDFRLFGSDTVEVEVTVDLVPEPGSAARLFALDAAAEPEEILLSALRKALRAAARTHPAPELVTLSGSVAGRTALGQELAEGLPLPFRDLLPRFTLAPTGAAALARRTAAAVGRRVLVIGVDGADWDILQPLIDAGDVPHFARLQREGAWGNLRSIMPLLSPLIWTTLATGLPPEQHGVLDFVTRTPEGKLVPVGSSSRRVPALWTMVGDYGKTVDVVGWLATYPAEEIPGSLVTDRFGFLAFAGNAAPEEIDPRMTWPPDLAGLAAARRLAPPDLDPDLLAGFVDVPASSVAAALVPGFQKGNLVNNLVHTLAAAETSHRLGRWLLEKDHPDLALFYFEMLDAVCHLFMPYAPPRLPWIDPVEFDAYRGAVAAAYREQDRILGDLLAGGTDSTLIVVLSDHGFRSGEARLKELSNMEGAAAARWHEPEGILLLAGAGVRAGHHIEGASVYDIAPTVLAYLGIPPPPAWPGRVLTDAISIPLPSPAELPSGLESLPGASGDTTRGIMALPPAETEATTLNNLGLALAAQGRDPDAIATFRQALARDPELNSARNNLATVLLRTGEVEPAVRELEEALRRDPGYAQAWMNLGLCRLRLRQFPPAVEALERAHALEPGDARILRNLGFAALEAGLFARAAEAFTHALVREETASARFGLGMALLQQGDPAGARRELERALELEPGHDRARRALEALGDGSP